MLRKLREAARIMLVYALLGLGTSVAVAWGLAARVDLSSRQLEHASTYNEEDFWANIDQASAVRRAVRLQLRSFGSYRR